ncbi:MAG: DNA-binding transcriptional ArsR family regulator [Natronomonas sp.]|jgi:DNA-binding transcriptional ArsR family regulator|uniref:ArsR/SmtB family transcription factor n=1 Tax=Natronomonas sp. TaxID=2184060 RepID=UPI003989CCB2
MSLLPSRLHVSPSPDEPKVLDIDGEDAEATFDALGSETAREMLATIYDDPRTPPEIREAVGTSLQNVHYHLDRLEEAGLIEAAGTGYSAKGNEMTVYGPASEAVVLFAGDESDGSRLRDALKRLFGLVAVVAIATLAFARIHEWLTPDPGQPGAMQAETASAEDGAAAVLSSIDPVWAFFLGGCVVVAAVALWWAFRPRLLSWMRSR